MSYNVNFHGTRTPALHCRGGVISGPSGTRPSVRFAVLSSIPGLGPLTISHVGRRLLQLPEQRRIVVGARPGDEITSPRVQSVID